MIFSKFIIGYGGVQKTSMQLVETLDKTGNIEIFSNVNSDKKYNFEKFQLNDTIPHMMINKITNKNKLVKYVNEIDFKTIYKINLKICYYMLFIKK